MRRALRPSTPGDFPVAGKVTKGAPRAVPFGIPRCEVTALFALAYASRRATFCHRKRPICHFEIVGKPVCFSLLVLSKRNFCFSIRGAGVFFLRLQAVHRQGLALLLGIADGVGGAFGFAVPECQHHVRAAHDFFVAP